MRHGVATRGIETLVLIEGGAAYIRSDAALRIARRLRFPWSLLGLMLLIPRLVREPAYRAVSRYRYRWFGRFDQDWVPPTEFADRFL
jgi:predicted DCC family thiol-disulfide oxidoreductase YuxK